MKYFNKLFCGIIILFIIVIFGANYFIINTYKKDDGRPYLVEVSRASGEIVSAIKNGYTNGADSSAIENEYTNGADSSGDLEVDLDLSKYQYLRRIVKCENNDQLSEPSRYDYCIRVLNDEVYRFEYEDVSNYKIDEIIFVNCILTISFVFLMGVLMYIKHRIIVPFHKFEQVPYELSKGNLSIPLEERKTKYFGRFIWGTNLLRENLEQRREKELNMHKEKKTLLLSLAHDIKTPLSVIKLNAQAVERNVYKDEEKRKEVAGAIIKKVDEIESYVSQIIAASKEDFLEFTVKDEEFYLVDIVNKITEYYKVKLQEKKIDFKVSEYSNCLLLGDADRVLEVMQNAIENAIKYGDEKYISISFGEEEECKLISIRNSGNTLKKEELIHVFDSFYRGANVDNKSGSGLGLYIARKLMTMMNGDVYASIDGDDFVLTLVVRMA